MILAAGFGTRLRPLTDHTPKALIEVGGVPMLERVARRLIGAGADRLIINVHHHADQVRRYIDRRDGFGVEVRISEEADAPLETGGGLAHATEHFRRDAPFILHNVDIVTEVDLAALYAAHAAGGGLATLAVSDRESSRLLRFDSQGLQGRVDRRRGTVQEGRPRSGPCQDRAFAGIHVIAPELLDMLDAGTYSIMDTYLDLAGVGRRILPHDVSGALWLEIGNPERLARARKVVAERVSRPSGS